MTAILLWLIPKIVDVLMQLGYEVSGELTATWIQKKFPALKDRFEIPVSLSTHKKELAKTIQEMPFLYKDLKEEVLNDYAEVDIKRIDLKTFELVEKPYTDIDIKERLRRSKKALFLGDAGIGKTTFQRHTILKIITDKPSVEYIYPEDDPIPFYIPLKVVDDSRQYPILNYLLKHNKLFSDKGKSGLKRLIKLAKQHRVFLFIDGYDEIQFLGGKQARNFVRDELDLILASNYFSPDFTVPPDPTEQDFYDALANCRVWLSSRQGFFVHHPISVKITSTHKESYVFALTLKGVGENRLQLIENVFNKYPKYKRLLGPKYFIKEIDRAEDKGLIEISYNPLFLTVMCYVYIRKVIDKQTHQVKAARNYYDLITECVNLLLIDLDEGKARELTPPEKEAELSNRNDYVEEKRKFLPYFAAELFLGGKTIFDLPYIKDRVKSFFETYPESQHKKDIIEGLANDDIDDPNFALQLILQGIFVIVDRQPDKDLYDFPHTRFKEVLASRHFNAHNREFIITNLENERLSELLYVFFAMSESRDVVLKALLEGTIDNPKTEYLGNLLIKCLEKAPPDYSPSKVLMDFFIACIDSNSYFKLPLAILDKPNFIPDVPFCELLSKKFKEVLTENKTASLSLCCYLLMRYNAPLLSELIKYYLKPSFESGNNTALQITLSLGEISNYIEGFKNPPEFSQAFFYLKGIYSNIIQENQRIPYADGYKPRVCYIITDPVIKITKYFIEKMGLDLDSNFISDLQEIKYKVYFTNIFLHDRPPDNPIRLENQVKRFILKVSRVDYQMYFKIMQNLQEYTRYTSKQIRFFN